MEIKVIDENNIICDGVELEAVGRDGKNCCYNCHFLSEDCYFNKIGCTPKTREDKRNIIWKEKELIEFNWDKITNGKVAIHCDTEEKANHLLKWADS